MKFGLKCRVDSLTEIGKVPVQVTIDGIDFTLEPSKEGLLNGLTVIAKIEPGKKFVSQIAPSPYPDVAGVLTVDVDQQFIESLKSLIEYIESILSFQFEVKKIYLEEAERFFVPENEEEMGKIDVMSFSLQKRPYPEQTRRLTLDDFKDILQGRSKYQPFKVACLFHREGIREFSSFRYIQAFYNFYFVLEDLYGQGKTNNNQIGEKFKSNQTLRAIVQRMLDTFIKGEHLTNIQNFLAEEKIPFGVDGILELVVQVRGNLHHYSGKSTKRKGTPLNQGDFESIAFLLMGLSQFSLTEVMFK